MNTPGSLRKQIAELEQELKEADRNYVEGIAASVEDAVADSLESVETFTQEDTKVLKGYKTRIIRAIRNETKQFVSGTVLTKVPTLRGKERDTVKRKLLIYLKSLPKTGNPKVGNDPKDPMGLTNPALARKFGVTRSQMNTLMHHLKRDGFIDYDVKTVPDIRAGGRMTANRLNVRVLRNFD